VPGHRHVDADRDVVAMALAEPGRAEHGAGEVFSGYGHVSMVFVHPGGADVAIETAMATTSIPTKIHADTPPTRYSKRHDRSGPRPSTAGGTCEYVGFTIRLHHRLVCQEPTGETQSQAGATPFDG
jgi:hypothetical protein